MVFLMSTATTTSLVLMILAIITIAVLVISKLRKQKQEETGEYKTATAVEPPPQDDPGPTDPLKLNMEPRKPVEEPDNRTEILYRFPESHAATVCPNCGVEHKRTARLCSVCGQRLQADEGGLS